MLGGRYEVLDRIGEGGTAEVFRARDHRLDRIVAVKLLRPQYGQDADARARFAVEARSAAALAVSNIVPVFDFGAADDGSLFIVMRYVDGPSLRKALSEHGALSVGVVLEIGAQIARALAEAHDHGLIHCDVKPGNILIDKDGTAHLTDFGTAKALSGSADLTRSGLVFGTAAYLAPEQATGGRIDARTDVYALGVVLYEALTGSPPFRGDDPVAVSYRQAHEPPTPINVVMPSIDPEIADLVSSSLEKDPARRPQTADEVARTLESIERRVAVRGVNAMPLLAGAPDSIHDTGVGDIASPRADSATVVIPQVPAAPVDRGFDTTAVAPAAFAASPSALPPPPPLSPALERGIVKPPPAYARRAVSERRDRGGFGPLLLLGALGLVALVALFFLMRLLGGGDNGVAGGPTPSPRGPDASAPVIIVPTPSATPFAPTSAPAVTPIIVTPGPPLTTPEPTPVVTLAPVVTPEPPIVTPEPPVVTPEPPIVTPEPPVITPEPPIVTPEPPVITPQPPAVTPEPPVVTPAPPPAEQRAQIGDESFVGDYPSDGAYHGRTASWVYGQGTSFNTMTAPFSLVAPDASAPARLEMVGLDGENLISNATRITINGVTIYEGPSPFPNDTCCGGSGPGNWGPAAFDIPAGVLGVDNTLTVSNLEPTDCTECPKYVMVDFAEVVYATQP
jgi:tRNA A-37 threonylcarbamoyl transferase component Bud32